MSFGISQIRQWTSRWRGSKRDLTCTEDHAPDQAEEMNSKSVSPMIRTAAPIENKLWEFLRSHSSGSEETVEMTKKKMTDNSVVMDDIIPALCGVLEATVEEHDSAVALHSPHQKEDSEDDDYMTPTSFVMRILKYSKCSSCVVVIGMIYLERLKTKPHGKRLKLTSHNYKTLLIVAVLVATKFCEDVVYSNKRWAQIGGMSLKDINALEIEFLFTMGFDLRVSKEEYSSFLKRVLSLVEPDPELNNLSPHRMPKVYPLVSSPMRRSAVAGPLKVPMLQAKGAMRGESIPDASTEVQPQVWKSLRRRITRPFRVKSEAVSRSRKESRNASFSKEKLSQSSPMRDVRVESSHVMPSMMKTKGPVQSKTLMGAKTVQKPAHLSLPTLSPSVNRSAGIFASSAENALSTPILLSNSYGDEEWKEKSSASRRSRSSGSFAHMIPSARVPEVFECLTYNTAIETWA